MEEFREVEGYNNYVVSNLGVVKSLDRREFSVRNNSFFIRKGRVLKPYLSKSGYLNVYFSIDGKKKGFRVNRLVALTFILNPDNKKEVNHKDGNKINNKVDNLEWMTRTENQRHADLNGLRIMPSGEKRYNCKISNLQVAEILSSNLRNKELALIYGVHQSHISHIIKGKHRKHAEALKKVWDSNLKKAN